MRVILISLALMISNRERPKSLNEEEANDDTAGSQQQIVRGHGADAQSHLRSCESAHGSSPGGQMVLGVSFHSAVSGGRGER